MRSIRNCLNKQLTEICQRSVQLEELSNKVAQLLPPDLAKTCQVGSFTKGCLILTTTDASWASQLRYATPELRDKLRKEAGMYQLSSIKITVIEPSHHHKKSGRKTKYTLSEKAKNDIINESQRCSYQPLKKALLHLAAEEAVSEVV
ncbi:MAG: DciA family protein [Legionellales bacterium]